MEVDQKSPLLRLPNELLSQIFSYVGGAHWRNVRRVCRRIRAVALPIMHRDKVAATLIDQLNRPSVIDRFERNPEFVRYVKSLTVHYHMGLTDCLPKCYDIIRDPPYVEDLSPLIAQMEQLQSLAIKGNSHEVCYGAELAKLDQEHRAHCTKSKWMGACTKFQDLFINSASSPILTNLQTCVLNFFDVDEFWDLSLRDAIFLHPHLKRLSISGAKSGTFRYLDECYRHSTVLEELTLRGCDISPDSLRGILTIPKALKRLTFNGRIPGRRAYSDAPRQSYIDSIQEQAHSLVALDLCLPLDVLYPFLREHAPNTPVDFHAFRSLQELTTVTQVIEGNPVLRPHPPATNPFPASLKTLRLRYLSRHRDSEWESPYRSAIRGWAATGALPSLTSVVFINHPTDNDCGVPEAWQMDSPSRIITFERDPYKCPAPLPQLPAGEKCSCCDSNREIALLPALHYL